MPRLSWVSQPNALRQNDTNVDFSNLAALSASANLDNAAPPTSAFRISDFDTSAGGSKRLGREGGRERTRGGEELE
eukprot:6440928-Pyramimonas_sp.AAC.1